MSPAMRMNLKFSWERTELSAETIEKLQCLSNWVKIDLIRKLYVAVDDETIDISGGDDEMPDPSCDGWV